jgi:hypothetical protein
LLLPDFYQVRFGESTLKLGLLEGEGNGTLVVASSDVVVVNGAAHDPKIVLAYVGWNVLVGYAPQAELETSPTAITPSEQCNITGGWQKDGSPSAAVASAQYAFVEHANGSFVATAGAGSWHTANGEVVYVFLVVPCSLLRVPCSLLRVPCSLLRVPCSLLRPFRGSHSRGTVCVEVQCPISSILLFALTLPSCCPQSRETNTFNHIPSHRWHCL